MSVQSKLLETALDPQKRQRALLLAIGGVSAVTLAHWLTVSKEKSRPKKLEKEDSVASDGTPKKQKKNAFDPQFLRQLRDLIKVMVPGVFSKEAGIIGQ